MEASKLLQWHYLIYLLPGGISALLLLLTSFRMGHKGGHAGHHSPAGHSHAAGHGAHTTAPGHAPPQMAVRTATTQTHHTGQSAHSIKTGAHGQRAGSHRTRNAAFKNGNLLAQLTGADRAPATLLIEAFCLVWAVAGYLANEYVVHVARPTPGQILPSLLIALVFGFVGTRLTAEMLARFLPEDETLAVSQQGLFGQTGKVVFRVNDTSGRIHIYDEHGTLHDEMCRLAPAQNGVAIEKGRTAMVVDINAAGLLLVEEVAPPT